MAVDPEFIDFLVSVDPKPREPEFIQRAAVAFAANEVQSEIDLMGIDVAELVTSTTCFIALLSTWSRPFGGARWTWPLRWRKSLLAQGRRGCQQ